MSSKSCTIPGQDILHQNPIMLMQLKVLQMCGYATQDTQRLEISASLKSIASPSVDVPQIKPLLLLPECPLPLQSLNNMRRFLFMGKFLVYLQEEHSVLDGNCRDREPTVGLVIDVDSNIAARCDDQGCDPYEVIFDRSGIFINIHRPNQGGWNVKLIRQI